MNALIVVSHPVEHALCYYILRRTAVDRRKGGQIMNYGGNVQRIAVLDAKRLETPSFHGFHFIFTRSINDVQD